MKMLIALTALASLGAALMGSPSYAATRQARQTVGGYTLEQWAAGAPSPGTP